MIHPPYSDEMYLIFSWRPGKVGDEFKGIFLKAITGGDLLYSSFFHFIRGNIRPRVSFSQVANRQPVAG
jgi:hypothetical protein